MSLTLFFSHFTDSYARGPRLTSWVTVQDLGKVVDEGPQPDMLEKYPKASVSIRLAVRLDCLFDHAPSKVVFGTHGWWEKIVLERQVFDAMLALNSVGDPKALRRYIRQSAEKYVPPDVQRAFSFDMEE